MQIMNLLMSLLISFTSYQRNGESGICGTPIINEALNVYEKFSSKELSTLVLKSLTVEVGDTLSFWTYNFSTNQDYQTDAICRAVGKHAYIFVETTEWDAGKMNQQAVDTLIKIFDDSTARDPTKGVYELDTELFGTPSDVDNDSLIYILLLDIKGEYIAGYFLAGDLYAGVHSNQKEIVYVDTRYPHKVGTIAHEFQHMIHWNHDRDEATWVNEGCSTFAEFWVGDCEWTGKYYLDNSDRSLAWWPDPAMATVADYDKVFLWTLYFYERFGRETITTLVNRPENSYTGIDSALSQLGYSETFTDILQDWAIANFIDNSDSTFYSGKYGYKNINISNAGLAAHHSSYPVEGTQNISKTGVDYISFALFSVTPDTLNISFDGYKFGDFYKYYVYMLPANNRNNILYIDTVFLDENWDGIYNVISANYRFAYMVVVGGINTHEYSYSCASTGIEETKFTQRLLTPRLLQNYPNPSTSLTTISYSFPEVVVNLYEAAVSLKICDLTGRVVRTLVDEHQSPNSYTVLWDCKDDLGRKLSSGVYLCTLNINGKRFDAMKMLLINVK